MAIYTNTFEGGADGDAITVANSGGVSGTAWGVAPQPPSGSGNQWVYATAAALEGSTRGAQRTLDTASGYLRGDDPSPGSRGGLRRPFYYPSAPSVTATICQIRGAGDELMAGAIISTGGFVVLTYGTTAINYGASNSPTLTPGQWYWLELIVTRETGSGGNGRVELKVDTLGGGGFHAYDTGATLTTGAINPARYRFGGFSNTTGWTYDRMDNVRWGGIPSGWIGSDIDGPTVSVTTGKRFVADYRASTPGTSGNSLTYSIAWVSGPNNSGTIVEPIEGVFHILMNATTASVYTVTVNEGGLSATHQLTVPIAGVAQSTPDTVERVYYDGTAWV